MRLPVEPPVAPMLAKLVAEIPADHFYEPKWDGFRSIVFRDGAEVEIESRNERPMTRYFPELVAAFQERLPARCVIDGEIVVPGAEGKGLDFFALQQRIHPATSRVNLLAEQTPATYIAFDLLALDDTDYTERPFAARRAVLEDVLAGAGPPVHLTPITRDRTVAGEWFERFEGAGLDGLVAKHADTTYQPNKRVMFKIKHVRTADCVVGGYRVHKSGPGAIGSLLLGLHKEDGTLASVGVVGAFPMARRRELYEELQPLVTEMAGHPWNWAEADWSPAELAAWARRGPTGSRWNPTKDLGFVPLRPERVIEVRYDYMEGDRFRHTTQFVRWRPDRTPASCDFTQLPRPAPVDLATVLSSGA